MDEANDYVGLVFEKSFEEDCGRICSDVRVMDIHLQACDYLITRAPGKDVVIPFIPGTDVQVIRLDGREVEGHSIPVTRIFFRMESDDKAHMLKIEPIPSSELADEDEDGQQELPFGDE